MKKVNGCKPGKKKEGFRPLNPRGGGRKRRRAGGAAYTEGESQNTLEHSWKKKQEETVLDQG